MMPSVNSHVILTVIESPKAAKYKKRPSPYGAVSSEHSTEGNELHVTVFYSQAEETDTFMLYEFNIWDVKSNRITV